MIILDCLYSYVLTDLHAYKQAEAHLIKTRRIARDHQLFHTDIGILDNLIWNAFMEQNYEKMNRYCEEFCNLYPEIVTTNIIFYP